MAVQPGTYNISLQRRADYYVTLQFKDGTGAPINLTDWIAEANALEDVKQLRSLYTRARAQGAPAEVLDMVKARAESLSGKDS